MKKFWDEEVELDRNVRWKRSFDVQWRNVGVVLYFSVHYAVQNNIILYIVLSSSDI